MNMSPCVSCTRVQDPRNCDDKGCKVWQAWFVGQWDDLRLQQRLRMEKTRLEPVGVNIGGTYYAAPHRVKRYLEQDPCAGCKCPRDLCVLPCKVKRHWTQAREAAMLN